jgi:hypothetical protein
VPLAVWAGPTSVEAGLRRCGEVLDRAKGDKKAMASAIVIQGVFEADRGRFDEARTLIGRARALLEEVALTVWLAGPVAQFAGWVELLAGDPAGAERELRWGYERLGEIGEVSWLSTLAALLAEAVYRQGRDGEAERLADASEQWSGPEDAYSHAVLGSVRAKVLARRGEHERARRLASESVTIADATDFVHLRVHVRLNQAEVLWATPAEARPPLDEAVRLAELKGSLAEGRRGRELLERLTGTPRASASAEPARRARA